MSSRITLTEVEAMIKRKNLGNFDTNLERFMTKLDGIVSRHVKDRVKTGAFNAIVVQIVSNSSMSYFRNTGVIYCKSKSDYDKVYDRIYNYIFENYKEFAPGVSTHGNRTSIYLSWGVKTE